MSQTSTPALAKSPGRPPTRTTDETLEILISATVDEYKLSGYAKSTMDAIAKRAGISLRTLYKFVEDKQALFRLATEQRIAQHILLLDTHLAFEDNAPHQALINLTRAYAKQILNHETLLTTRLVIAESDKFPELAKAFLESTRRIAKTFDYNFARIAQSANINIVQSDIEMLRLMLIGAQRSAIFDLGTAYSQQDIEALADRSCNFILAKHQSI